MKIPFDIEYRPQIESGEYKVETRDGRPARIICWDAKAKDGCSVVALLPIDKSDLNDEAAYQFSKNGTAYTSKSASEDCADLFIITPEPELTEFEKVVAYWLETAKDEPITNEMIVDAADDLMFCARQQIIRGAEWSEEDEYRIRQIERIAQQAGCTQKLQEEIHDWLKALRPQPHWKPSEEQILTIIEALKYLPNNKEEWIILENLMHDLKKL